jgi:hypothetical protein
MTSMPSSQGDDEIWMLRRGQHDPQVWPFRSEELAEDFKAEHGLWDHKAVRVTQPEKEHEPVCARCREDWPCRHVRIDSKARAILAAERNRCGRCKKQIGWHRVVITGLGEFGEDVPFHGKLGACFNEARRLATARNDEKALRKIADLDEGRRIERARRAAFAERRGR